MKRFFFTFLLLVFILPIKSQNEFGVWDSIRDLQMSGGPIGHPYGYTYGIRVFPKSKDSATISKIIEDNNIFFCLIPKKRTATNLKYPEEIYAFANLDIHDFSLGGGLFQPLRFYDCIYI